MWNISEVVWNVKWSGVKCKVKLNISEVVWNVSEVVWNVKWSDVKCKVKWCEM